MALFEVEGWNLKSKAVKYGGENNKPLKKKKAKKLAAESAPEKRSSDDAPTPSLKAKKAKTSKSGDEVPGNASEDKTNAKESEKKGEEAPEKELPAPLPPITAKLTPLQQKMMTKLSGSRFRWINEQLYTTTSEHALDLVKKQPALFDEYHQGFRSQVQGWPENPVDVFVRQFQERTARPVCAPGGLPGHADKKVVIADMGCGEAQFALDVNTFVAKHNKQNKGKKGPAHKKLDVTVHSFDLKKANERITVADIKNVPLPDGSCNIVIFCLALMGTNFLDFIEEAYRLLAPNGELWIAEIKSRFLELTQAPGRKPVSVGEEFVESLKLLGFYHKKTDNENKMFTRFEFFKPSLDILKQKDEKLHRRKKFVENETRKEELEKKRLQRPEGSWLLKPCIYKRR